MKANALANIFALLLMAVQAGRPTAPAGSISGRVVPEYTGLGVQLAQHGYDDNGEMKLVNVNTVTTSKVIGKFGEFRFDSVEPDEYYIYVEPFGLAAPKGEALPLTFYPGTSDFGRALRINVEPGENLRLGGLNLFSSPTSVLSLRLFDETGLAATNKQCVTISWKRHDFVVSDLNSSVVRCGTNEQATVRMPVLATGTYDVFAGWTGQTVNGPVHGAGLTIEIRNLDSEIDVVISAARVEGSVAIEEPDGRLRPGAGLTLNLKPKRIGPVESVQVSDDGSFRRDQIGRNDYDLEFSPLPSNAYIARLTDGDHNVLKDGLEVRSTDVHLNGLISLAAGNLEGFVMDTADQRQPGAIVALIPNLPDRPNHLFRAATADENGSFVLSGIAPGAYQLFAWSKLKGAAYKNADFMKPYEGRGAVVERNSRKRVVARVLDSTPMAR